MALVDRKRSHGKKNQLAWLLAGFHYTSIYIFHLNLRIPNMKCLPESHVFNLAHGILMCSIKVLIVQLKKSFFLTRSVGINPSLVTKQLCDPSGWVYIH